MRLRSAKQPRWILAIVAVFVASPLLGVAAEPETPRAQDPRLSEEPKASRPDVTTQAAPRPVRGPAFELAGIVKLEGDASFALLQEPELTMGKAVVVRTGQSIGAYRLVAIEDDRVRLESATGVVTVLLGGSKGSSGAEVAKPPPNPTAAEPQGVMSAESAPTAEESIEAAMKGTRGGDVMNILKKAFGLGAK